MPPLSFNKTFSLLLLAAFLTANATRANLIISQYYEGVQTIAYKNCYIELYNTGDTAVDLGAENYQIGSWLNNVRRETWKTDGAATRSEALTGTIAPHSTFVIAQATASTTVGPFYALPADYATTNDSLLYSGDDTVVLFTGSPFAFANVKDVFGITLAMVTTYGTTFASDKSFVRNANITTGTNQDFNAADWTEYSMAAVDSAAPGTTERIGFHTVAAPEPATAGLLGFGLLAIRLFRRR